MFAGSSLSEVSVDVVLFTGSQRKERKGSISMSKPAATKRSRADSSDNTVNSTSGSPNPAKVGLSVFDIFCIWNFLAIIHICMRM